MTGRFITYKPPEKLGLPKAYFLELPKDDSKPGWKRYADNVLEILVDIYNVSQDHFFLNWNEARKNPNGYLTVKMGMRQWLGNVVAHPSTR